MKIITLNFLFILSILLITGCSNNDFDETKDITDRSVISINLKTIYRYNYKSGHQYKFQPISGTLSGIALGNIYETQQPGTEPVYQFFNLSTGEDILTINPTDARGLSMYEYGWRSEGIVGYAYRSEEINTVPLCHFYSPKSDSKANSADNYYTTHLEDIQTYYKVLGISFYMVPNYYANIKKIYRFTKNSQHFYLFQEKSTSGLLGTELGAIYINQESGTEPVYQVTNIASGEDILTINPSEVKNKASFEYGWRVDGIVGYAYRAEQNNTIPLCRFFLPKKGDTSNESDHYYTTSLDDKLGYYIPFGISFYMVKN